MKEVHGKRVGKKKENHQIRDTKKIITYVQQKMAAGGFTNSYMLLSPGLARNTWGTRRRRGTRPATTAPTWTGRRDSGAPCVSREQQVQEH